MSPGATAVCSIHPDRAAIFYCDGCGRLLCPECVEEGHRLLFCRHCRERALPIDQQAPATVPERRRAAAQAAPYSLGKAFGYPLRGRGGWLFKVYVILIVPVTLLEVLPGSRMNPVFCTFIGLLLPGLLCAVVRATAAGDDEVPDWPDYTYIQERVGEIWGMAAVAAVSALPVALLLLLGGCDIRAFPYATHGRCLLLLLPAGFAGVVLGFPACGAVAYCWSPWVALRLDLHRRALAACGRDVLKAGGLFYATLVCSLLAVALLDKVPVVGALAGNSLDLYVLLVGAHLVGLVVRRHEADFEAIYL